MMAISNGWSGAVFLPVVGGSDSNPSQPGDTLELGSHREKGWGRGCC